MILLRANAELKQTFEKLIQTAKVPVKWNGIFAVVDNYIILQGEVRSLFFHFDTRKVTTNIIEIPETTQIQKVGENRRVQNAINMVLYAFGKWGTIQGIRVEKEYPQLNELFVSIMQEYNVEPEYTPLYMRFYRNDMRVTYEDVIQMAIEYSEEDEDEKEVGGQGLWHKITWKKAHADFTRVETTIEERRRTRLGNNFYMVGYLCPLCGKNLHMVVYPVGKEFRIETEEGGVLLARAATCEQCHCFYTPRPRKLFAEGDIYVMEFGEDTAAYEDYMELLGRNGERVSNCHCNEYADGRAMPEEDEAESLEELYTCLPELSEEELRRIEARMEEGFYPDESIRRFEHEIKEAEQSRRSGLHSDATDDTEADAEKEMRQASGLRYETEQGEKFAAGDEKSGKYAGNDGSAQMRKGTYAGENAYAEETVHAEKAVHADKTMHTGETMRADKAVHAEKAVHADKTVHAEKVVHADKAVHADKTVHAEKSMHAGESMHADKITNASASYEDNVIISPEEREEVKKKYEARLDVLERYSERQLRELKKQLEREKKLLPQEREAYLSRVEHRLADEQTARLAEKATSCEGKNYVVIKRVLEEVEKAQIPMDMKLPILEKLQGFKRIQAGKEVELLVAKMPKNLDRSQYEQYVQRIRDYEDVDFTPHEAVLKERRAAAEKQEIANTVKRARKVSREDFVELKERLHGGAFLPELIVPYIEKIDERIREIDTEAIALICPNPMQMTFEEGLHAYEQIEQGDFLPELKKDALKNLKKRLTKIKTDECELLVKKLKEDLENAGIAEMPKHHFYPARKVLLKQAKPEEVEVIEYALASYAAGKGMFEYPILVVDATRSGTGKEGIIITPEHLYYSTMFSAYGVQIDTIKRITASTGLLNKGLYMYQKNGAKTKLPYAVENKDLSAFAEVLDAFIQYLQEKPDSRSLAYLANEKHETICCFRCGYEYKGGNVCPKCGYQNNE